MKQLHINTGHNPAQQMAALWGMTHSVAFSSGRMRARFFSFVVNDDDDDVLNADCNCQIAHVVIAQMIRTGHDAGCQTHGANVFQCGRFEFGLTGLEIRAQTIHTQLLTS